MSIMPLKVPLIRILLKVSSQYIILRSEVALSSALPFHFSLYRNKYFQWTVDHDVIMCREVLVSEPFNFKPRSPERGKVWEKIAQELNAIEKTKFRVTTRVLQDRYSLLITKHSQKSRRGSRSRHQSWIFCLKIS